MSDIFATSVLFIISALDPILQYFAQLSLHRHGHDLWNILILFQRLQSKFGCHHKYGIYGFFMVE